MPETQSEWVSNLRHDAMTRFAQQGLPGRDHEDWRYSDLARLLPQPPSPPAPAAPDSLPSSLTLFDGPRLVFCNGVLAPNLSLMPKKESGLQVLSLARALNAPPEWLSPEQLGREGEGALPSLNTALMQDGALIRLDPNTRLNQTIHLVFFGPAYTASAISLGQGAQASVIETHACHQPGFASHATRIQLDASAQLRHVRFQNDHKDAIHVSSAEIRLNHGAGYQGALISHGAQLARIMTAFRFRGTKARASLASLVLAGGKRHADVTLLAEHAQPECQSRVLARTALGGSAQTSFQAKALVARNAQKSVAHQETKALILSPHAVMRARPELAILADDVECTHGSAIGEPDEETIFYLRQRGLSDENARQILVTAFLAQAAEKIPVPQARLHVQNNLNDMLRHIAEKRT